MIAPNYNLILDGKKVHADRFAVSKNIETHTISYTDKDEHYTLGAGKALLQGKVGGTQFSASSELNNGMECRTYDSAGECKSKVFYDKDGVITSIEAYNGDGDVLYMSPAMIKYNSDEKVGIITKSGNIENTRTIDVKA